MCNRYIKEQRVSRSHTLSTVLGSPITSWEYPVPPMIDVHISYIKNNIPLLHLSVSSHTNTLWHSLPLSPPLSLSLSPSHTHTSSLSFSLMWYLFLLVSLYCFTDSLCKCLALGHNVLNKMYYMSCIQEGSTVEKGSSALLLIHSCVGGWGDSGQAFSALSSELHNLQHVA